MVARMLLMLTGMVVIAGTDDAKFHRGSRITDSSEVCPSLRPLFTEVNALLRD